MNPAKFRSRLLAAIGLLPLACGGSTNSGIPESTAGASPGGARSGAGAAGSSALSGASAGAGAAGAATGGANADPAPSAGGPSPAAGAGGSSPVSAAPQGGATPAGAGGTITGGGAMGAGVMGGAGPKYPCRDGVPGDDPSGNTETCRGGLRHRVASNSCVSKLPRPPSNQLPSLGNGEMFECLSDADCTARPHGYCELRQSGAGGSTTGAPSSCNYGCLTDADCDSGSVCDCGPDIGTCRTAHCKTDADCNDGSLCTAYDESRGCDYIVFACQTSADECGGDLDCAGGLCTANATGQRVCSPTLCPIGRPFLVQGSARVALPMDRDEWTRNESTCDADRERASSTEQSLIAEAWTRVALMEHASVAAFARFVLELLSFGAPAELVTRATRAQADEIAHARAAFDIASTYAGRPIGPGALDVSGSLEVLTLEHSVFQATLEGCFGEVLAALEASAALAHVTHPVARRLLERVAIEESEHAELAFRFVSWAIERDPSLSAVCRRAMEQAIAELSETQSPQPPPAGAFDDALLNAGVLPELQRERVRKLGVCDVVVPCLLSLLEHAENQAEGRAEGTSEIASNASHFGGRAALIA